MFPSFLEMSSIFQDFLFFLLAVVVMPLKLEMTHSIQRQCNETQVINLILVLKDFF